MAGGTVVFELDAGVEHAGQAYWLLGSSSGTAPGYLVGGTRIPLVPDPYLSATIDLVPDLVTGGLGTLDHEGRARAKIRFPNLGPDWVGRELWHAFAVFGPAAPGVHHVSAPRALLIRE